MITLSLMDLFTAVVTISQPLWVYFLVGGFFLLNSYLGRSKSIDQKELSDLIGKE